MRKIDRSSQNISINVKFSKEICNFSLKSEFFSKEIKIYRQQIIQNCKTSINDEVIYNKCYNLYKIRRFREKIFGDDGIFCDPAWDILLDLFMAYLRGDKVSVTSAGFAACAPISTALRWLAILEKDGLVSREQDTNDRRRAFVRLTDTAVTKMRKIIEYY
jgi:hypothetical protein